MSPAGVGRQRVLRRARGRRRGVVVTGQQLQQLLGGSNLLASSIAADPGGTGPPFQGGASLRDGAAVPLMARYTGDGAVKNVAAGRYNGTGPLAVGGPACWGTCCGVARSCPQEGLAGK